MAIYAFDHTAISADNLVTDPLHSTANSVALFPTVGAFYRRGMVVEGTASIANPLWVTLTPNVDYHFSPLFLAITKDTGEEAYTYLVMTTELTFFRVTYQAVGHHVVDGVELDRYEDVGLLESIRQATFNPKSAPDWLNFSGSDSYNTRFKDPLLKNDAFCQGLTSGISAIAEQTSKLSAGDDVATLVQVTNVELRQGYIEDRQSTVETSFAGIQQSMVDVREVFSNLQNTVESGYYTNVANVEGASYNSVDALTTHTFAHNLNSFDLDVQVWAEDVNGVWSIPIHNAMLLDLNTLVINSDIPIRIRAVVRKVTNGGFIYESLIPSASVDVNHNLGTGFLSVCVWVDIGGIWTQTVLDARALNNNTVQINLVEQRLIRVVLQKPLPNSFIHKYSSVDSQQFVNHRMNTGYIAVSVWVESSPGVYVADLLHVAMDGLNSFILHMATSNAVKVVVQPCVEGQTTLVQEVAIQTNLVADRQDTLELKMDALTSTITVLSAAVNTLETDTYDYRSPTPLTIHNINHNLNDDLVDVTVWVQDPDLKWRMDSVRAENVDLNNIQIVFASAYMVRVRISRS